MLNNIINTEKVYKNKYKEEVAELLTTCKTFNGSSELNILKVYDKDGSHILALTDHEFKKNYEVHPNLSSMAIREDENTHLNCSYLMEEYPEFEQLVTDCEATKRILVSPYGLGVLRHMESTNE